YKHKSEGEKRYDEEVVAQKAKIQELQDKVNEINSRLTDPNAKGYVNPNAADYLEIKSAADSRLSELNAQIHAESQKLLKLYQDKGKMTREGSNQGDLFSAFDAVTSETEAIERESA